MMNDEPRDFDKDAASWDENAGRVKMAFSIADSIIGAVPLNLEMDVLDFGCGTGLLTLQLQPVVRSITGVDSSVGMLAVLENKIEIQQLSSVRTEQLEVETGGVLTGTYDLVVSSMTLHHVREIKPLLAQFFKVMKPGGYLCVADLDPDNGYFHGNNAGVFHRGFDRRVLQQDIASAGFKEIDFRKATEIVRFYPGGVRPFAIFLVTARK
jgi:ubiquinone/menaquinone biosynthesis C-methylase UbiE